MKIGDRPGAPAPPSRKVEDASARTMIQGRALAIHLCVLLKTARVHDVGNVAFQGPLTNFIETIDQMWTAEGDFKIQAIGDFLYLNHQRLRVDASSYPCLTRTRAAADRMRSTIARERSCDGSFRGFRRARRAAVGRREREL